MNPRRPGGRGGLRTSAAPAGASARTRESAALTWSAERGLRPRRGGLLVLLGGLVPALAGCFSYVPAEPATLDTGTPVRIHLNPPREVELLDITRNQVVEVQGEVIGWRDSTLALSVFWITSYGGAEFDARGETARFSASEIVSIEEKRFAILETAGLAAAGVAAFVVGVGALEDPGGGGGQDGGGGTQQ